MTGERIRDKIAASKKKGMWMGGVVPLGYRLEERKLHIDEAEAATVRLIFVLFLELGSVRALQRELRRRNIRTRIRKLASGRIVGGVHLTNGPLSHLLRNRHYLGEINHRGTSWPGEHTAIVDAETFAQVQSKLEGQRVARAARLKSNALLLGKVFNETGERLTPSFAIKQGVRYRYYISTSAMQARDRGLPPVIACRRPPLSPRSLTRCGRQSRNERRTRAEVILASGLDRSREPFMKRLTGPRRRERQPIFLPPRRKLGLSSTASLCTSSSGPTSSRSNIALISTIRIRPKTCWSLGLGRPRTCGAPFSCPVRPSDRAEGWRAWSAIV